MKKLLCKSIIIMLGSCVYAQYKDPVPQQPVQVHVHMPQMSQIQTTTSSLDHLQADTHTLQNSSILSNSVVVAVSTLVSILQDVKTHLSSQAVKSTHSLLDWCYCNRYGLVLSGIVTAYIVLCTRLMYDQYWVLADNSSWGAWKDNLSFESLCLLSQKELEQELLADIQKRYLQKKDPSNFIQPLILFLQDIENRIKIIKRYVWYCNHLDRFVVRIFFPLSARKKDEAVAQLQRMQFIHHIFMSWMAEQNIVKYTHSF